MRSIIAGIAARDGLNFLQRFSVPGTVSADTVTVHCVTSNSSAFSAEMHTFCKKRAKWRCKLVFWQTSCQKSSNLAGHGTVTRYPLSTEIYLEKYPYLVYYSIYIDCIVLVSEYIWRSGRS